MECRRVSATRGEKKAFDFSQESLQWGMERNTLETDKKWGNLKGTEKAMNRFRLFKSQLNARATGKLSRSKAERTKLKLENYKQKCIESIKGHVGPLLQEYQVFCAMILQQTGVSIVEPEIPQLMLSSLASIRVDPAVDESQVDHGGDAESGEQELQKGKEAMANDN
jgi:intein/homing endonuclease